MFLFVSVDIGFLITHTIWFSRLNLFYIYPMKHPKRHLPGQWCQISEWNSPRADSCFARCSKLSVAWTMLWFPWVLWVSIIVVVCCNWSMTCWSLAFCTINIIMSMKASGHRRSRWNKSLMHESFCFPRNLVCGTSKVTWSSTSATISYF